MRVRVVRATRGGGGRCAPIPAVGGGHLPLGDGSSRLEIAHPAERVLQAALLRAEQRGEEQRRLGRVRIGRMHVDGRGLVEIGCGLQRGARGVQ